MLETSARLLRLLGLFQSRPGWSGAELAERLGVTTRTVRNDVDRLRRLGYPVAATPGVGGGYRLGAGATLPPLLLEDDEAVAVAVGLRTAAFGTVTGIEETSLRALAKLEHVLPPRLRSWVDTLQTHVVAIPGSFGPTVDADVLTTIASACLGQERLRFDYLDHETVASSRDVEPHRLVCWNRRWYLVAWDIDRSAWRTFRVDRIQSGGRVGPRFGPRELPDPDIAAFVQRGVGAATWAYRARVTVHAPADVVAGRLPPAVGIEAVDESTCVLDVGADTPHMLALYLGMLDVDFEVSGSPDLVEHLRTIADRYLRSTVHAGR